MCENSLQLSSLGFGLVRNADCTSDALHAAIYGLSCKELIIPHLANQHIKMTEFAKLTKQWLLPNNV